MRKVRRKAVQCMLVSLFILAGLCLIPFSVTANEPVTIRVATASDPGEFALRQELVTMFQRDNPHINVELIPITNRVDEQVVLIASGLSPDILYLNPSFFGYFVRQGALEDLQPYVQRDGFSSDEIYPALLHQMGEGNFIYALPFELTSIALLYNQSLFDELGLAPPPPQWNSDAWNWSAFTEYSRWITKVNNETTERWGVGLILGALDQIVYPWVFANGGSVLDVATGSFGLSDPASADALQFLADLIHQERVAFGPMWGVGNFANETVGMLPFGRWLNPLQDLPFQWNVAPLPKGQQAATMIVWLAYGMSAKSQHKEEAWEFLKFLLTEEAQLLNAKQGQALSVLSRLGAHPDLRYAEPIGHYAVFAEGAQYAQPVPYADNDGQISGAIWNALVPVWSGNVGAQQAMERIKPQIEALVAESTLELVAPQ